MSPQILHFNMDDVTTWPSDVMRNSMTSLDGIIRVNTNKTNNSCLDEEGNPFILDWYFQLFYILAFGSMVLIAAGGNAIVIWIVLAHRRMRTVTNYFLVNLAVADALISIFNTLFSFTYMLYSDWPYGKAYCKFSHFISSCTISASVFTFMAIAVDRYIAIVHPMKPRIGAGTVVGIIVIIWAASISLAAPTIVYADTISWDFNCSGGSRTICHIIFPDDPNLTIDFIYNVCLTVFTYFLPLVILAVTYTRVGMCLWGSKTIGERTPGQVETIRSKRKVVKMMISVVVIFGVCWFPQNAFFLVANKFKEITEWVYIQHVYLFIYWLAMSNSMYNPFIYCWMNARFQNGFKYAFRWLPCVNWDPRDLFGLRSLPMGQRQFYNNDGGTVGYSRGLSLTERSQLDLSPSSSSTKPCTYRSAMSSAFCSPSRPTRRSGPADTNGVTSPRGRSNEFCMNSMKSVNCVLLSEEGGCGMNHTGRGVGRNDMRIHCVT